MKKRLTIYKYKEWKVTHYNEGVEQCIAVPDVLNKNGMATVPALRDVTLRGIKKQIDLI